MKKIFTPLFILLIVSCKESGVQLAKPSTFVRYFNGGFQDNAQAVIETADKGFLILANSGISCPNGVRTCTVNRIKVIKTDAYGNQQWLRFFPNVDSSRNFKGYGLSALKDASSTEIGYIIVGEEIYGSNDSSALLIATIKLDSTKTQPEISTSKSFKNFPFQAQGWGVTAIDGGDLFVMGTNKSDATKDMFCTRFESATLNPIWTKTYGTGGDVVANKLFYVTEFSKGFLFWATTRTTSQSSSSAMGMIKIAADDGSIIHEYYNPSGSVTFNLSANDVCQFGNGFALAGSYSHHLQTNYSGLAFATTDLDDNPGDAVIDTLTSQTPDLGNSITGAPNGVVILGTIYKSASNYDYRLFKFDVKLNNGVREWSIAWQNDYGGQFLDYGKQVIPTSDGGFVVLGTTVLANVCNVMLMKTDSQGNIQ